MEKYKFFVYDHFILKIQKNINNFFAILIKSIKNYQN